MKSLCGLMLAACVSAPPLWAQTHVVIVSGLAGDAQHREKFHEWATAMIDAAVNRFHVVESNIVYLAERVEHDAETIDARSTKENVEETLRHLAGTVRPNDNVFILLMGHGSYQGDESRLSLPGPDMTARDFARVLGWFPTQTVALVNTASASGDFVPALSGERRAIVTATKSPFERNETVFGRYFVQAFTDDVADTDKDEHVSVLEAFEYARHEVTRFYESENRLLTEHAVLDDNGDGEGSAEPDPLNSDGGLAAQFLFGAGPRVAVGDAGDDPQLAALYQRQAELQQQLVDLRARKDEMEAEAYENALEQLLLELARTAQAIRERGGEGGRG